MWKKLRTILATETKALRELGILSMAFRRLWQKGSKTGVVLAFLFSMCEAVLYTLGPKVGRHLIDTINEAQTAGWQQAPGYPVWFLRFPDYYWAVGSLTILTALVGVLTYAAFNTATGFARNATYQSQVTFATECFAHYLSLDLAYHVRSKKGMFARLEQAVRESQDFLYNSFFGNFLRTILTIVMVLATSYAKDERLFIICFVWILVGLYTNMMFGSSVSKEEKAAWNNVSKANERSQDVINNILEVKLCGREEDEVRRRREDAEQQLVPLRRSSLLWRTLTTIQNIWQWSGFLVAMFYVVLRGVFSGTFTSGEVVQFSLLYGMLFGGFMDWLFKYLNAHRLVPKLRDVRNLLDERSKLTDRPDASDFTKLHWAIEFRNVTFTYPESNGMGVKDVTLTISKGQIVALVGKTGCGKSTLSKLLVRAFDPDSGTIRVDGIDITEYKRKSYQRAFTTLTQEGSLFNRTIRENIAYKRPEASMEEIVEAAKIAQAHEFISRMPGQYEAIVYEQAANLSGGQKRRIALARAVLAKDAEVVILDEPTTGLDPQTAGEFMDELLTVFAGKTVVVITHDQNIMHRADQVIFLEHGRVRHIGSPEYLERYCEDYRNLVRS